jgi:CheY-like chemotaxis protein
MAKIVIIDDEEDIRDVLGEVLTRAGHQVKAASNSSDGLEMLRNDGADLVITDIIMPGKDGIESAYDIRMEFPNTRIIVISGGGNVKPMDYEPSALKTEAYLASASAAGADMTLSKPFDRKELLDAVNELVQP